MIECAQTEPESKISLSQDIISKYSAAAFADAIEWLCCGVIILSSKYLISPKDAGGPNPDINGFKNIQKSQQ